MAKKNKAKAGRIPKTIGGVKLPKELRKSGEKLIEKAGSPEGRRMMAAGLAMASAAMARTRMPPASPVAPIPPVPPVMQSGEGAPPPDAPTPPNGTGTPVVDPAQIADAVGRAATAFFDGLFARKR